MMQHRLRQEEASQEKEDDRMPEALERLLVGAYVKVTGIASLLPEGKHAEQPVEIIKSKVEVVSPSTPEYQSICPPSASDALKLDQRHIYLRDHRFALITKLRAILIKALRKYFETTGCWDG